MKKSGIELLSDLSGIIDSLGATDAMSKSVRNPEYIDELVSVAHGVAEQEFNLLAAAKAATGSISHMYEWGTQGINRGRTNMRPNPMDPRARLWEDYMTTKGMKGTLGFTFKPSIAIVPKPTSAATGMSPEVIQKLSDHVFTWKARVMEQGETVNIRPKNAKALLIPLGRGVSEPGRTARGFTMSPGPIRATPGAKVSGNFTAFWTTFWETQGQEVMEKSIVEQIEMDFKKEIEVQKPKPVRKPVASVKAAVKTKSQVEQRKASAKARARKKVTDNGGK